MQLRFECVVHYVSDLDRAVGFYRDLLGLEMVSKRTLARFEIDGVRLELAQQPETADLEGGGNARLCLGVDDLEGSLGKLESRGARVGRIHRTDGGAWAGIKDPDGNEILLWESKRTL